jgi:hypothetical protein
MATLRAPLLKRVRGPLPRVDLALNKRRLRTVGLQVDAQTVLDYVHAHPQLAKTPIVRLFSPILGVNLRLMVLSADSLWSVHRRRSRNRPRLSQSKSRKQEPSRYSLYRHVAQRLTVATTTHTDHRARHREHVHVPSAAHPDCDALVGPILIPLPSEVGIVSQGKNPTATLKPVFEIRADVALTTGTKTPTELTSTYAWWRTRRSGATLANARAMGHHP